MYSPQVYPAVLKYDKGENPNWYIDARSSPKDFWSLMCVAHPEIASKHTKVSKTKLKKAMDLIFEVSEQIKLFEKLCVENDGFEKDAWFLEA